MFCRMENFNFRISSRVSLISSWKFSRCQNFHLGNWHWHCTNNYLSTVLVLMCIILRKIPLFVVFKYWKGFKFSLIAVTTHLIPKRQKDQKSGLITPGNISKRRGVPQHCTRGLPLPCEVTNSQMRPNCVAISCEKLQWVIRLDIWY